MKPGPIRTDAVPTRDTGQPSDAGLPRAPWPATHVLVGRALTILLVASFLTTGIVLRQGLHMGELGGVSLHLLPRWKMFSGVGVGLTQARYLQVRSDGSRTPVDIYATLGKSALDQPKGLWRLEGHKQAVIVGRRLCRELGPGTELRLIARTATLDGWKREKGRKEDLCADPVQ